MHGTALFIAATAGLACIHDAAHRALTSIVAEPVWWIDDALWIDEPAAWAKRPQAAAAATDRSFPRGQQVRR